MKTIFKKTAVISSLCFLFGCSSIVTTKPVVSVTDKRSRERCVYYNLPRGIVKVNGTWNPATALWDLSASAVYAADADAGRFRAKRNSNFFFDDDLTLGIDPSTGLLTTANGTTTDQTVNGIANLAAAASAAFSLPTSFGAVAAGASKASTKSTFNLNAAPASRNDLDAEIRGLEALWAKLGGLHSDDFKILAKDVARLDDSKYTPLNADEDNYLEVFLEKSQDAWANNGTLTATEITNILHLEQDQVHRKANFSLFQSQLDPFDATTLDAAGVVYHSAYVISPTVSNQVAFARFDIVVSPLNSPPKRTLYPPVGPLLSTHDIRDRKGLAKQISDGADEHSKFIKSTLSPEIKALLAKHGLSGLESEKLEEALINRLNECITNASFSVLAKYTRAELEKSGNPQTLELFDLQPKGAPEVCWLNRWLLNQTYHHELSADNTADGILVRDPVVYAVSITAHLWSTVNTAVDTNKNPAVFPWTYNKSKPTLTFDNPVSYNAYHQGVILPDLKTTRILSLEREPFRQTSTKVTLFSGMVQNREDTHQSLFNAIAGIPKTLITGIVPIGSGSGGGNGGNQTGGGQGGGNQGGTGSSPSGQSTANQTGGGQNGGSLGANSGGTQSSSPPIQ